MTIKILLKKYKQDEIELFQFNNKNRIETRLRKGLVGLLNQLILYTLIFRLLDHYKEVLI